MDFLIFVTYGPAISGILAIALVALFNRRHKNQLALAIFALTAFAWLFTQFSAQLCPDVNGSLLLIRLASGLSVWLAVSFYIFVVRYLGRPVSKIVTYFMLPAAIILSLFNILGLVVLKAEASKTGITIEEASWFYLVQLTLIGLVFLSSLCVLIVHTVRQPSDLRMKNYVLIGGVLQAVLFTLCGTVFFAKSALAQNIIPTSTLALVGIFALGMVKYRLFDVRSLIARVAAYSLSLVMIVLLLAGGMVGVSAALNANFSLYQELLLSIAVMIAAIVFQPLKRTFDRLSNRVFYQDAYDGQNFINEINSTLVTTQDFQELLKKSSTTIERMMRLDFCSFYIDAEAALDFHVAGTNVRMFARESWQELYRLIGNSTEKILVLGELRSDQEDLAQKMANFNIEAIVKMTTGGQSVGQLVVGPKRSGGGLSSQDVQILEIIADEVAIAVQNALRFEQITQFNVTLQHRIDDATKKLRKSNDKLRQMDETKDEFISMASHQLRTPLTSVKGYLSMVLEGDAGELTEMQRKLLDQAFVSSQRMVYLIADLLNVSRLRTGKFVIETMPTNLADVIQGEVDQLRETAEGRNLELVFDRPRNFPTLMLDETKTRQVIMNFMDNAIYYTKSGGHIAVSLKETDLSVEFTVKDNGIGVPKAEQHHLFNKFYRAGNARLARPDGTGLGLFMAKKVIIAQGGSIIFSSEEGKGSTFGFTFPKAKLLPPVVTPATTAATGD